MNKNGWQILEPKPWQKRHPRPELKPAGPPRNKYGTMLWQIDPASPAADALRDLRAKILGAVPKKPGC